MNVLPALPNLKPNATRKRRPQLVYEDENYTQHRVGILAHIHIKNIINHCVLYLYFVTTPKPPPLTPKVSIHD